LTRRRRSKPLNDIAKHWIVKEGPEPLFFLKIHSVGAEDFLVFSFLGGEVEDVVSVDGDSVLFAGWAEAFFDLSA
jgi:hypothetical protein